MGRAFEFRKARKLKRWGKMSKVFTRIGKDIVIAVKEGGPNPDTNSSRNRKTACCFAAGIAAPRRLLDH